MASHCLTVDEAIGQGLVHGFLRREEVETVFQARQRIFANLGRLLPRIEFGVGNGMVPLNILNTMTNLLGVMIPSNWFNFAESKLMYSAEKSTYVSILRNTVTDIQSIYFNIHRVLMERLIYDYYATHVEQLITEIKSTHSNSAIPANDLLLLENYAADLRASATFLLNVNPLFYPYDLAVAIGLPIQGEIGLLPVSLPKLDDTAPYLVTDEDLQRIKTQSMELKSIRYLIRAADYNRLSRIFSFLTASGTPNTPTLGISFGLDTIANIRISSSQKTLSRSSLSRNGGQD